MHVADANIQLDSNVRAMSLYFQCRKSELLKVVSFSFFLVFLTLNIL